MPQLFRPTILLAVALMAIIVMMILPMPAWVLDIGLALSFALAILIFTVTLFIERPLDFSSFPTILLASLMLRLSLNVSSTKLIIGQGHTGTSAAGGVIEGFASFVMGGSVFLGLVVFGVLLIVNFIVITKGAARMAEVGARFALDGMPGRQMAIDADVAAGAIDHHEAKRRRDTEQNETTFFGSLDGASKFVKGDAIAGLLITLLNLVMGLAIGTIVHGMPFGTAIETYSILTVGDGLVTQIPAVIISIAAALLLARGGATGTTDFAIFSQMGRFPPALVTVAVLMALFALVPGLPVLPFLSGAIILGAAGFVMSRRSQTEPSEDTTDTKTDPAVERKQRIADVLDLDDMHVEFADSLVPMILDKASGLGARIDTMRNHVAEKYGLILPEIRLTDNAALPKGTYVIRVQGVEMARAELEPDKSLVLLAGGGEAPAGRDVREPVYGAPARWIGGQMADEAALSGLTVIQPTEVLATHLLETIRQSFPKLLGMRSLTRLLDELTNVSDPARAAANRRLFDSLIPEKVPMDLLLGVLRLLLEERISIRNLPLIVESIAEARSAGSPELICEHVRQRLSFQIIGALRSRDGTVPLIQLDPGWEDIFARHQKSEADGSDIALPPDLFQKLVEAISKVVEKAGEAGQFPALVTSVLRRRFIKTVLAAKGMQTPVVSFEELGGEQRPALVGTVAS